MRIGIIGLPQTGKRTLFDLLTSHKPSDIELASHKPIKSFAEIKDSRFDRLAAIYKPKKEVRARIDIELLPNIERDSIAKGDIFKEMAELDIICHVVRVFKNDSVYHISGSVDPKRDIDYINSELILNDLIFIEKRLEKIDKELKKTGDKTHAEEKVLLLKLKTELDKEFPLRLVGLTKEEDNIISSYPLLTRKAMIVLLNVSEDELNNVSFMEKLKRDYEKLKIEIMQASAEVEDEIAKLESESERKEFLKALRIGEPAVNVLSRLLIKTLNLISFFTVKHDELRQWLIRSGSTAHDAAGLIHSDLQRGFIRAEVIKYDDLISYGGEEGIKEAGKLYLKGKNYMVEDGDIITVRFNV